MPRSHQLARCPFCDSTAVLEETEDRGGAGVRFSVGCKVEGCIGYMSVATYAHRAEAVAAWNRRGGEDA
jgi:hypothetical protein